MLEKLSLLSAIILAVGAYDFNQIGVEFSKQSSNNGGENLEGQFEEGHSYGTYAIGYRGSGTIEPGIAAGERHNLAWTEDGVLWAWGDNRSGQLGDRSTTNRTKPVPVWCSPGMERIVQADAGNDFSIALDEAGQVWAWGDNTHGRLGIGNTIPSAIPVRVAFPPSTPPIDAIVCGERYALALDENGDVWGWGYAAVSSGSLSPVKISKPVGMGAAVAISAGEVTSYALDEMGCFGHGERIPLVVWATARPVKALHRFRWTPPLE